jgi:RNA polymerase sigma-70 factor (ECF subfamily)
MCPIEGGRILGQQLVRGSLMAKISEEQLEQNRDRDEKRNARNRADSQVVLKIRDGDTGAYRILVEQYQGRIYSMVLGMVKDEEHAWDITQDSLIKAFKKLDSFRIDSSFYTWLYRIASNSAIDYLRKAKRRRTEEFDDGVGAKDQAGMIDPMYSTTSPAKDLERSQLKDRIFEAMQHISPEQRQIVLLREVEGYSYKEISDTMDIPEGTVMSRLFYARRKLQELLRSELVGES